jgi:hypothetical protein
MKISETNNKPLSGLGASKPLGPASGGSRMPTPADRGAASDQVQLSSLSSHLAAALGNSPPQIAKLAGLTKAVLGGGYSVDASVVSDSIVRHSLQFGGPNYL